MLCIMLHIRCLLLLQLLCVGRILLLERLGCLLLRCLRVRLGLCLGLGRLGLTGCLCSACLGSLAGWLRRSDDKGGVWRSVVRHLPACARRGACRAAWVVRPHLVTTYLGTEPPSTEVWAIPVIPVVQLNV